MVEIYANFKATHGHSNRKSIMGFASSQLCAFSIFGKANLRHQKGGLYFCILLINKGFGKWNWHEIKNKPMKRAIAAMLIVVSVVPAVVFGQSSEQVKAKAHYTFRYGYQQPFEIAKDAAEKRKLRYPKEGLFSGNVGIQCSRLIYTDSETGEWGNRFRGSATAMFNAHIYKELILSTTLFYHIRAGNDPAFPIWLSDMFYAIKWFNWRPHTFSFGYENYADNRFDDSAQKWAEKFLQGFVFVSFNGNLPAKWINKIRLDESTNFSLVPTVRYFPTYRNETDEILSHKVQLGLSARYTIWFRLYLEAGVYAYPIPGSRMPWDPDFTYGFGYFDYRPWRVSVTYGNWIANRFTFQSEIPGYSFLDGNVSVLFNYRF